MIDEAFMPFARIIERLVSFRPEVVDEEAGVRSYIYACELHLPIELDVVRDESGALRIGSTPPLYDVDTSFRPTFHALRFTADVPHHDDAD
ncbi:MAG: hypothetical protein HYU37_16365 [Acidobacteria bacterium]|nr:hypothetical protein [Acidobacteriota bacterium]